MSFVKILGIASLMFVATSCAHHSHSSDSCASKKSCSKEKKCCKKDSCKKEAKSCCKKSK